MSNQQRVVNIHYGEIALKGRNRSYFEKALLHNLTTALRGLGYKSIKRLESRIIVVMDDSSDENKILEAVSHVFGIEWYSSGFLISNAMSDIQNAVFDIAKTIKEKSLKLKIKRSNKKFPMISPEIGRAIGSKLEDQGFIIDLDNPEYLINLEILTNHALVSREKISGLGGLPIGNNGAVLSLLSGGIDSPVSSWLMMRRGCEVDFIHVHSFAKNSDAEKSKIISLVKKLQPYSPKPFRVFLVPYSEFYKKTFDLPSKVELVVFRRFMLKLANRLAQEHGYLGLVTGDNVGQVASQTLDNLLATNEASALPVYRPLVAYDKQEIINLAKKIGTYDVSIKEYKDCCSLVAQKHPSTKVKLEKVKKIELEAGIDDAVEKTLKTIKIIKV